MSRFLFVRGTSRATISCTEKLKFENAVIFVKYVGVSVSFGRGLHKSTENQSTLMFLRHVNLESPKLLTQTYFYSAVGLAYT